MNTEETKDKKEKAGCSSSGAGFRGFEEMFEKMRKCCMGRDGSTGCSAIMDGMMKEMMERCRGPKADGTKQNSTKG